MKTSVAEIKELLAHADPDALEELVAAYEDDPRKGVQSAIKAARKRSEAQKAERQRVAALYEYERSFAPPHSNGVIVGLDEVGRGSVAGPLAVGAVILNPLKQIDGLNDSKQITPPLRVRIAETIEREASFWTVHYVEPHDIDRDGMSASLRRAFSEALAQVERAGWHVDAILLDGNPLHLDPREVNIVKGDAKCASIAAASIVAKVERDALMKQLATRYPHYGFEENKGYASAQHIEAIRQYGLTDVHRASFCKSFMQQSLF